MGRDAVGEREVYGDSIAEDELLLLIERTTLLKG